MIRIDADLTSGAVDLMAAALAQESSVKSGHADYERAAMVSETFAGWDAVKWTYHMARNGQPTDYTTIYLDPSYDTGIVAIVPSDATIVQRDETLAIQESFQTSSPTPTTYSSSTLTTAEETSQGYLQASQNLAAILQSDDQSIVQLATEINNTAPNVPQSVYTELQTMSNNANSALQSPQEVTPPSDYSEANGFLDKAASAMITRIDQTAMGIQAMWSGGTVTPGTPYFNAGRTARDSYRAAFQQYQAAVPAGQ